MGGNFKMKNNRIKPVKIEDERVKLKHIEEDIAMLNIKSSKILEERVTLIVKLIATRDKLAKG
jgi:hypothetical protein